MQQSLFVADVDSALDRYIARAPLYLGTAAFVAAAGTAAIVFGKLDTLEGIVLTLALTAPLHGIVALGTSNDAGGERLPASEIIARILRRWPELFVCQIASNFAGTIAIFSLMSNDWSSALALIPFSLAWGALSLADVAIALEDQAPESTFVGSLAARFRSLGTALAQSFAYAFRLRTFNRTATLALIQVPCVLLQDLIRSTAAAHHVVVDDLLVALWLSCAIDGMLEAIYTRTLQRLRSA